MVFQVPDTFLWGASTSAHQTEGNNVSSDWWGLEHAPTPFVTEPSGDAADSFHRWREDMDLLAAAGFRDYRFSIEWARIEPSEGRISRASLLHYRAMVEGAIARGLRPLVTLHHFSSPAWFSADGGWLHPEGVRRFTNYVEIAQEVLQDDVARVCTINEPNMVAIYSRAIRGVGVDFSNGLPSADPEITQRLIEGHNAAAAALRRGNGGVRVGWSVAMQGVEPLLPTDLPAVRAYAEARETPFVEAARGDDWFGVQAYTRVRVTGTAEDPRHVPAEPDAPRTLTGWEVYPAAVGSAVREAHRLLGDVPIIVTENGIATSDDDQRIAYTAAALESLQEAIDEGIRVDGYFHWSLIDNYEWGSFGPTFGLIAFDADTFGRYPKPSLSWLGSLARARAMV